MNGVGVVRREGERECVCVFVCMGERESERVDLLVGVVGVWREIDGERIGVWKERSERERETPKGMRDIKTKIYIERDTQAARERMRERERERERKRERETETQRERERERERQKECVRERERERGRERGREREAYH